MTGFSFVHGLFIREQTHRQEHCAVTETLSLSHLTQQPTRPQGHHAPQSEHS